MTRPLRLAACEPPPSGVAREALTARHAFRLLTVLVALLVAALPISACSGASDKAGGQVRPPARVLHFVNTRARLELQPFLDQLSAASAGQLVAEGEDRFESESVHADADAVRLIQSGQVDLALIPTRAFDEFAVTSFDALAAPLEVDSMALQAEVLASDIPGDMLAGVEPLGLVGIGVLPGPMRVPAGITRPLVAPKDYSGARIGVSPSELSEQSLRTLGAVPVRTPFDGADISHFDGIELYTAAIAGDRYDARVRWITANIGLWPRPLVLVLNQKRFATLSASERGWLRDAARAAVAPTMAVQASTELAVVMCRRKKIRVVLATPAEASDLRKGFAPIYRALRRDATTADFLNRIDNIKAEVTPDPAEILDCSRLVPDSSPTPSDPTGSAEPVPVSALNGKYLLHLTAQELGASGEDPAIAENRGEFRLALDQGRFVFTQRDPPACTWAYGTYTFASGRLELVVSDGGGMAPNHATNKPGEVFDYTVSVYRGAMRWSAIPDAVSPPGWAYKPWLRQPDQPTRKFLDLRCAPPDAAYAR
jgi:TRAP-type C4-dicarboxylate transport system substrate-binding protein